MHGASFLDYFIENFGSSFEALLKEQCKQNPAIALRSLRVPPSQVYTFEIVELEYKAISFGSVGEEEIEFVIDVSIVVNFVTYDMLKANRRTGKRTYSWNSVFCQATLGESLENVTLTDIKPYEGKHTFRRPLTKELVPVLPASQCREYADEILQRYYPEALRANWSGTIKELPQRMGISWEEAVLSDDASIFGKIIFSSQQVETYTLKNGLIEKERITFPPNTILIDPMAASKAGLQTVNETIAHECVHYFYHRKAVYFARIFDWKYQFTDYVIWNREENSPISWIERQANAIAPFLAMPTKPFRSFVERQLTSTKDVLKNARVIIRKIASRFGVPVSAVKKRLKAEGYDQLTGAVEWVDGKYIPPTQYASGLLADSETITISLEQLALLFRNSPDFQAFLLAGNYLFVENHLVINNPKYIHKAQGRYWLTETARKHPEACCVKFKNIKKVVSSGVTYDPNSLARDNKVKLAYQNDFIRDQDLLKSDDLPIKIPEYQRQVKEALERIRDLPFDAALKELMTMMSLERKELAIDSGLTITTIGRYINGETLPDKPSFIKLCIGLQIGQDIFDLLRTKLDVNYKETDAYDSLLLLTYKTMSGCSKHLINSVFVKMGFDELF